MKRKRVFFAALSAAMNMFYLTIPQAIMGPRMVDFYHFSKYTIGLAFATPTISYILTCTLVGYVFANFEKRFTMMIGFFIVACSYLLVGPSQIFGFGDAFGILLSGCAMIGFAFSMTCIPVVPEMLQAANLDNKYELHQAELKDRTSSIFNMTCGLGQISGPIVGGWLCDSYGFKTTADICSLIIAIYFLIYFFGCDGYDAAV